MTQGEGQANVPTTRFLLTPSPYLQGPGLGHTPLQRAPKPWVRDVRSVRMAMVSRAPAPQHRSPYLSAPILSPHPSPDSDVTIL